MALILTSEVYAAHNLSTIQSRTTFLYRNKCQQMDTFLIASNKIWMKIIQKKNYIYIFGSV